MFIFEVAKKSILNSFNLNKTRQQIQTQQLKKFRRLVAFIHKKSPFYREIIETKKINIKTAVPEDFPALDKSTLLKNFDNIVTDKSITKNGIEDYLLQYSENQKLFLNKYIVVNTSGSSGEVGLYVYNKKELAAGIVHSQRVSGLGFGQRLAFIGAVHGHFAGVSMMKSTKWLPILYTGLINLDINLPLEEVISKLNEFQPTIITAYSSILRQLSAAKERGILKINPRVISCSGEPISPDDQLRVENVFGVPVANVYASSEHLLMGVGYTRYNGMYLFEDDLIFHPMDNQTFITNLYNYTLPLIRYRMSDILNVVEDENPAYPFLKVKNLVARQEQVPYFINALGQEDFIYPVSLVGVFAKNLVRFQFVIKNQISLMMRAQLTPNLSETEKQAVFSQINQQVRAILLEKNMQNVSFQIEVVDSIDIDPKTGKFKLIVNQ